MSGWSDRADAAHRAGQHSYARVCEGRARAAWAREESLRRRTAAEGGNAPMDRRTVAEQLEASRAASALHGYINPPDPAWGDFCWQVTDEGERCGWTAADHVGGAR